MPVTAKAMRTGSEKIPATMQAAVYHGKNDVRVESVSVPEIGPGEILVRVHTCGICGTDLKKISTGSHSAPRIFGHEIAGQIAAIGEAVKGFEIGDRVMVFHHIPCGNCYYCERKVFAQCPTYKKVGVTAGHEPSGGGFSEYVRVMDWIVNKGVVKIPEHVSYEQASYIEPVNTCLKGIETLQLKKGETVLVVGQGPIGIILALLAKRTGARLVTSDLYPERLKVANSLGLTESLDGRADWVSGIKALTEGRGADAVILAVAVNPLIQKCLDATRPGGRVLLFAQTTRSMAELDPSGVCMDEKTLLGSYSASVDLQNLSADFVFNSGIDLARLISHRFPLGEAVEGLQLAANPQPDSMKIVISPGLAWGEERK
jgi:L-iditol 2-dehydrogenase